MAKVVNIAFLRNFWSILCCITLFSACWTDRYLEPEQRYLTSNYVVLKHEGLIGYDAGLLTDELSALIGRNQTPNSKTILGITQRRRWLYFKGQRNGKTYKRAQAPVYCDTTLSNKVAQQMTYYMQMRGFFDAKTTVAYRFRRKTKADVMYIVNSGPRYLIDTVRWQSKDTLIQKILDETVQLTALQRGAPLSSGMYEAERQRILRNLRNRGYYFFALNYIATLDADTTGTNANVWVSVQPGDSLSKRPFYLGDITVEPRFVPGLLGEAKKTPSLDTVILGKRFLYYGGRQDVRLEVLANRIFLKTGQLFNQDSLERTIKQLDNLGLYKFVSVRPIRNPETGLLDVNILLTPYLKIAVSSGIDANFATLSDGQLSVGAAMSGSTRNRNLFGGAEKLNLSANVGTDLFFPSGTTGGPTDAYRFAPSVRIRGDYTTPSIVDPFGVWKQAKKWRALSTSQYATLKDQGNTRLSVDYQYNLSIGYESYQSLSARSGFSLQNGAWRIEFNPVALSYYSHTGFAIFDSIAKDNPYLLQSTATQLTTSLLFGELSLAYKGQSRGNGNAWQIVGRLKQSGAEIYGINQLYRGITGKKDTFRIGNANFAEFIKLEIDFNYVLKLENRQSVVFRLNPGLIMTYGDYREAPYLEQLYVGGANSLRGWRLRGIGPGTYYDPLLTTGIIPYQTGDLRLEGSFEYRFPFFWKVESALFFDGGNIWTFKEDPDRPGSRFTKNTYDQFAINTGIGIRLDFFVIARLDIGKQLRTPALGPNETNPWSPARKIGKLNYNFALGYPF